MGKILEVSELSFKYEAEQEQETLQSLNFEVQEEEWLAIVGQNGSGKSTLARLIDGLLEASKGSIKIAGEQLTKENVWSLRRKIGMVFQNPDNQFVGATVEDDVAFGLENQGIPREEMQVRVKDALKQVGMLDFRKKEPARLSGGQKQRVAIAGVIALRPKIVILDEATSMLDPEGRLEVIQMIQEIKKIYHLTVLSITHDVEEVTMADRVLVMNSGKLVQDTVPEELFAIRGVRAGEDIKDKKLSSLSDFGLELPFSAQLAEALREAGFSLPVEYLTDEALMEELCQ